MENKNQKAKYCTGCGEEIHPKRIEILPSATTCVKCSTTGPKRGVVVSLGEGDHNYNDLVIMGDDEMQKYRDLINSKDTDEEKVGLEVVDLDKDDVNFTLSNINAEVDQSASIIDVEEIEEEIPEDEDTIEKEGSTELFTSEID
jgi:hypothetical protein